MQVNYRSLMRMWQIARQFYLSGQKRPFLSSYKLTYACNLKCIQCPYHNYPSQQQSFEGVLSTLDQLKERGNKIVVFEGGEPFLWRDGDHTVREIILEAQKRFYCVGMTTNGTQNFTAVPDILWVSIDGKQTTHDYLRGKGVYDQLREHIQTSSHPRILAHITINALNVHEVPEVIEDLAGLVKGFTIQFYYPYTTDHTLLVSEKDRVQVLDSLLSMKKNGFQIMNSLAGLQALKKNTWRCEEWLVDNANPNGSINQGCYLKDRAHIHCGQCGFSPFTEMSLAYHLHPSAITAGFNIFLKN